MACRACSLARWQKLSASQATLSQLCRLHELDWPSRRLLRRLAQARQLENPAQLFLEPTWFEAANMPAPLRPFRPQLAELRQHLFAVSDHAAASWGDLAALAVSPTSTADHDTRKLRSHAAWLECLLSES